MELNEHVTSTAIWSGREGKSSPSPRPQGRASRDGLHLIRIFNDGDGLSSVRSAMFIATPPLKTRPSSFRSGTERHLASHRPPAVGPSARCHAAPLELGGPGSICGYKHGAPKGAFCLVAVTSLPGARCVYGATLAALPACGCARYARREDAKKKAAMWKAESRKGGMESAGLWISAFCFPNFCFHSLLPAFPPSLFTHSAPQQSSFPQRFSVRFWGSAAAIK